MAGLSDAPSMELMELLRDILRCTVGMCPRPCINNIVSRNLKFTREILYCRETQY